MPQEGEGTIFNRHSVRSDGSMGYGGAEGPSEQYPSLTNEGVEKAQKRAEAYEEALEKAPNGAILFIGGSSEEKRTKETADVIGGELAEKFSENEDVIVLDKERIEELERKVMSEKGTIRTEIANIVSENPDKKIVVSYPLFLKELSLRPHQREYKTAEHTPYMKELFARVGKDYHVGAREYFRNNGIIETDDGVLQIPTPQETAEIHLAGIERLRKFAQQYTGDRPLTVAIVGHGWQLDALAVYLTNDGIVNLEGFEQLFGDRALEQPEGGEVTVSESGDITFHFRGREFPVVEQES